MSVLNLIWRKLTPTLALHNTSGAFETAFFGNVYRALYLAGFSSYDKGVMYLLYSNVIKILIVSLVLCEGWFLFSQSSDNLNGIIENMCVTLIQLSALYRYTNMLTYVDTYKKLVMATNSPYFDTSTSQRKKILDFWLRNNDKYFKLLLGLGTCTLAAWYIYPLVDDFEYNLVVTVRLPFNYQTDSLYPITYIMGVISLHYAASFVMVNDLIMQAHLIHLLCQFTVLNDCFENIIFDCAQEFPGVKEDALHLNDLFVDKYTDRLRNLVEQHRFVLSLSMEFRKILSYPMLAQLSASSMLICFTAYQVTVSITEGITKFMTSLLYLGYNMFALYVFCRWCDEIKTESENIRNAVYCSGWERGVGALPRVRLRLMLVAARTSRPVVLTAGGLYNLSLTSYATLVKTSYSALTVLLRVNNK